MHAGGDILVTQKEHGQNPFFYSLAGDGTSRTTHAEPARTNCQIFVQKITISVFTHANAKSIKFQDTAGLGFYQFNDWTAVAGVPDSVMVDFGPHGYPLAINTGLDIVEPGSGSVTGIHVEGYYRLAATINLTTATTAN